MKKKVSIRVQHSNTNTARSGKVTASSTMSPEAAAERCAMKCAGLIADAVHDFPAFETSGITLRKLAADADANGNHVRSLWEAEWNS